MSVRVPARAAVRIEPMIEDDVASVVAIEGPTQMSEEHLRAELHRPWARLWVAREGGEAVAFLIVWHVADELHVLNVATRADRRRRGVARELMGHLVDFGRRERVKHVLLEVRRSNLAAIALYRALGFFAMGVRARYYPDDEDAVEMVLAFDTETGEVVPRADEVKLSS
ncbi:MAG TPA: ribosomal protein S18-alanine N-acetyltransferase [Polyangiaceae bacterium]|nr:ribosomal protein S18-alanine N-acetyltransferase [Polyangiaceae bacterium]